MYKNLRILFCILAVACAAATVFIFVFFNLWGFLPLGLGIAFAALMFECNRAPDYTLRPLKAISSPAKPPIRTSDYHIYNMVYII